MVRTHAYGSNLTGRLPWCPKFTSCWPDPPPRTEGGSIGERGGTVRGAIRLWASSRFPRRARRGPQCPSRSRSGPPNGTSIPPGPSPGLITIRRTWPILLLRGPATPQARPPLFPRMQPLAPRRDSPQGWRARRRGRRRRAR